LVTATYSPLRLTLLRLSLPGEWYWMVPTSTAAVAADAGSITAPASTTAGRPTTRAAIDFGFTPGSVGQTWAVGPSPERVRE
jgi:hypothetical protein